MSRVLVTGATGFLGRYVVRQLLAQGYAVRCLSRQPVSGLPAEWLLDEDRTDKIELVHGDLVDQSLAASLLHGCKVVIHVASSARGSVSSLFLNNVVATRHLVAAASAEQVRRFVHVSSLSVLGVRPLRKGSVLNEDCPLDPSAHLLNPYTYSKTVQERVIWEAHEKHGLPSVIVRPGVIYGPGRDVLSGRVGLQVGRVLLRMGGRQRLPYTYVENCADAVVAAATAPNLNGVAVNIVDDELPTGRMLLKTRRRVKGRLPVIGIPGFAIPALSWLVEKYSQRTEGMIPPFLSRYRSDAMWKPLRYSNAGAKTLLRWNPRVGLQEGVRRTLAM